MELTEFLLARLDEDEQVARATSPWPWVVNAEGDEVLSARIPGDDALLDDDLVIATGYALSNAQLRANTAHIARHDPARVLAEVAAKRRIVELHGEWIHECMGNLDHATTDPYIGCTALRLLALPYASHSDYREEWRP